MFVRSHAYMSHQISCRTQDRDNWARRQLSIVNVGSESGLSMDLTGEVVQHALSDSRYSMEAA